MISQGKREAIYLLHKEGMGQRKIARSLRVSRSAVSKIIEQKGKMPETIRKDKIEIDSTLLIRLYKDCNGWIQRVHEKLIEEEGISVGYSTLTSRVRELDLGKSKNRRCGKEEDVPGEEMQHDTSPYKVRLGGEWVHVQASLLYFRYSKIRYLKFYRSFNRFNMKCFFHEALTFWGWAAGICIIDNTNLARLRGTGKNAVIVPEMKQFSRQYGFKFVCHEIGHANRKAGDERGFYTTESNFLPGRIFKNLEDMNKQAFCWATQRMANKPIGKTRLIPISAFEHEKAYLNKLIPYIEAPYLVHGRRTDQYGYAAHDGNFYWIPGTKRYDVKVFQYADHLKIYHNREQLGEYEIPPDGVKNEMVSPKGQSKPPYKPRRRNKPTANEEKTLRGVSEEIDAYLTFALKQRSSKAKHKFIRELYGLHKKIALSLFIKTVKRAYIYRISDMKIVEQIAILQMKESSYDLPIAEINQDFKNRDVYLDGLYSGDVDLSAYDKVMDDDDDE